MHICAGRDAAKDTFLSCKPSCHAECFITGNLKHFINHVLIIDTGHKSRSDSLNFVRSRVASGQDRRLFRLNSYVLYVIEMFLKRLTGSAYSTARSDACYKIMQLFTLKILDYFRAGCFTMNLRIGRIVKLLGLEIAFLLNKLFRFFNGSFHAFWAFGQDDLCPKISEKGAPFETHCLRHCKYSLVPSDCSYHYQCNPCVTGCRLYYCVSRFQQTLLLRIQYHCQADTVFYTAGGVKHFQFCKNLCALLVRYFIYPYNWCSSDSSTNIIINRHFFLLRKLII